MPQFNLPELFALLTRLRGGDDRGDPELQGYLRDPSSRPDINRVPLPRRLPPAQYIDRANRRIRPLPSMPANVGPMLPATHGRSLPPMPEPAPVPVLSGGGLPMFPPQARVGMDNLGRAAGDVLGYAQDWLSDGIPRNQYQPGANGGPGAMQAGVGLENPSPLPMPGGDSPNRVSLAQATDIRNAPLADYLNSTMGLRVAPAPFDQEPWRQPAGGVVTPNSLAPGMASNTTRRRELEPPSAPVRGMPAYLSNADPDWQEAKRLAREALERQERRQGANGRRIPAPGVDSGYPFSGY